MKVGIVLESEIYARGIENYLKTIGKLYISVKFFSKEELNDKSSQKRFLKFISEWKLLFLDFNSLCSILAVLNKNPDVLERYTGKLVLLRMGCKYIYKKEDIIPDRFKSLKLVIDISIPPSITSESFKRLILPLLYPQKDTLLRSHKNDNTNLKLSPGWKVI